MTRLGAALALAALLAGCQSTPAPRPLTSAALLAKPATRTLDLPAGLRGINVYDGGSDPSGGGVRKRCPYDFGARPVWTNTTGRPLKVWGAQLVMNLLDGYGHGGMYLAAGDSALAVLGHSTVANGMTPKMETVAYAVPILLDPGVGIVLWYGCEARTTGLTIDVIALVWVE